MKKEDILETAILLLGLWSLYNGLISLFYVVYYFFAEAFSSYPVYDPNFYSVYSSEAISFGILTFLCFAKRTLLLKNLNFIPYHEGHKKEEEKEAHFLETNNEINYVATKIDLLEIGIVILCLAILFTALPHFLYAILGYFKSKTSENSSQNYNLTLPFVKIIVPLVIIVTRDKAIQLLYPANKRTT
jgi:hypothetical protein